MYDSIRTAIGSELGESIAATLQHVALIKQREDKLKTAREEAEVQLMHRIGCAHRSGEIGLADLFQLHKAVSDLGITGRATRWNEQIDIPWNRVAHLRRMSNRYMPNGPENTWTGEWPIPEGAPRPHAKAAVVYVLFDDHNEPCYVGSTDQFTSRLNAHSKGGKHFARWHAHPCRDREHAYLLEDRLLRQHMPYLNRKASR